ncbi:MAG TPA: hypothetical protein QF621_01845, partial [Candidatus Thalassarchaeaceae archaeon]|nr:hypothetical protein [Candidatus Thalassarchaeaceae archaeon]
MSEEFLAAQEEWERQQRLQEQAALEEASLLNPEVAGKQGPAFVPGEREVAEAELEQTSQEEEGSGRFGPIITDTEEIERRQQAALGLAGSVYQGLVDTGLGLLEMGEQSPILNPVSLMPGHKGLIKEHVKPFWHEMNPESDNPINKTIRLLSGVVIPSMIAPQAITSRIAALPWAKALPPAVRTTGAVMARIGIDTTIVAASSSADDENAAKALNDAFGWNIPWATREGAGPDERRWYNLAENAGFAGFGELISGTFALRTYLKNRPKKNMFEASWIHEYDIKKHQLLTEGAKPGTQIEWDPGLVVTPKTEEAVG